MFKRWATVRKAIEDARLSVEPTQQYDHSLVISLPKGEEREWRHAIERLLPKMDLPFYPSDIKLIYDGVVAGKCLFRLLGTVKRELHPTATMPEKGVYAPKKVVNLQMSSG